MNNQETPTFPTDNLRQVLDIINNMASRAAGGNFIFRGEPKHFDKVSSSLYRQYKPGHLERTSIEVIQQEILEAAKKYTRETHKIEILSELQHYGGKTNLIDFSKDYLIALFFACDGFPLDDGRVILVSKAGSMASDIEEPRNLSSRVIVQKSIFVTPTQGFLEPDEVVNIPKDVKEPLLEYLRHSHNISTETIYNDLQGFIRLQSLHHEAYKELYLGSTYHREDEPDLQHAIDHYTKAIGLNPRLAQSYCGRGGAYLSKGDYDKAIQDFNRAIAMEVDHSCAYANRGRVYLNKKDYDLAIEDFNRAIEFNPDFDNQTSSISHYFRGVTHSMKNDFDLAILDFDFVLDRDLPGDRQGLCHERGLAYLDKKELDRAIKDFDQAITIKADFFGTFFHRGIAKVYKGDYMSALQDFNESLDLNEDHPEAFQSRGVTRLFLGEWDYARTDLLTAMDMGVDIASTFCDDFGSVTEFERKNNLEIPKDIAIILTR